jgi:hypothetical protein
LGRVGDLDPANEGAFEIVIPDFTRDPVFKGTGAVPRIGSFGEIELVIHDSRTGRPLGAMKPDDAGPESGLKVQDEYPDPIKFTSVR